MTLRPLAVCFAAPSISRYCLARKPRSGARRMSLITATESAPASITAAAFSSVIPPMATIGLSVSSRTRRIKSAPTTGSGFAFDEVAKIGPTAM